MNGWSMQASTTARRIRRIANPSMRLRVAAGLATAAVAAPALLYLFR